MGNLKEVFLYQIQDKNHKKINSFRGKEPIGLGNFSGGAYPSSVARYYPKPSEFKNAFVKAVTVYYFNTSLQQSQGSSKYRLRILSATPEGAPGADILAENLIIQKGQAQFRTKIDLLKYRIKIPENGFFVAVEHLFIPENEFTEVKTFKVNDSLIYRDVPLVKYAPIFKGVLEENNSDFKSYYRSISGWKMMNHLDSSNRLLEGKIPAPGFKVEITN